MLGSSHDVSNRTSVPGSDETPFPLLVSLACHDLRTPLATIYGFARTLARSRLEPPGDRYVEMIETAAAQLADLIDELGLAARIESARYEPALTEEDTLALAQAAAQRLGKDRVDVAGTGAAVRVDRPAAERAIAALARCTLRHGGLESVRVTVDGPVLEIGPVTPASAPVVLGEDLRDLGAAVAVVVVRALGGAVSLEGERLRVALPTGP